MDDVSMNPGSGRKIFTSRGKESLGQLRNFLFEQSSFHLKHTRETREGYNVALERLAHATYERRPLIASPIQALVSRGIDSWSFLHKS
jgi:hypothetical protein